jgi:hypothetical protein
MPPNSPVSAGQKVSLNHSLPRGKSRSGAARRMMAGCGFLFACLGQASAETVYGISSGVVPSLLQWDSATPGTVSTPKPISGLGIGESILGIDIRPLNGTLYALGGSSRLYTLDIDTAIATPVGTDPFTPTLQGTSFGFDFNPTIDRIRVVSDTDQNLVLNPITGVVQLNATPLNFGTTDPNAGTNPTVVNSAYSNSFGGATATQLYGIEIGLDILVTQANNAGTLGTVGTGLGVDVVGLGGFDISGLTGTAFGAFTIASGTGSGLYSVDLASGAATFLGAIGAGDLEIVALAVVPEPSSLALAMCGVLALAGRRRPRATRPA